MDMKFKMEHDFSELVEKAAFSQIERALTKIGLEAEKNAKKNLTEKKAVDTGRLRNSVTHTHDKNTVYVGTNVEYAPYIEFGTSKMAARPYLEPAIADHLNECKEIIKRELET